MIFKFAFATRVREIVRVLRGLPPDDAVRQRTLAINEQLARVRPVPCNIIVSVNVQVGLMQ